MMRSPMPSIGVRSRKARHSRAWRAAAVVLAMLAAPIAAAGVTAAPAAAATTYEVTATIGVGSSPNGVGVDPATDTVYVANQGSSTVSVINGATNTVTATIGVGSQPFGVGVDPATDTVYVANEYSNSVSVIDGVTNTVTATIGVGSSPTWVGVDPATDTVYVSNGVSNNVSVIDGATNTVTATIGVGGSAPTGVGVDPSTDTVYVANVFPSGTVSVIDGATNTVTATIPVGAQPEGVGVDTSTHTVYVPNLSSRTVSVIDGTANTVTATIGVGSAPYGVGVDPSTHTVYVSNTGGSSASVIDGAANTVAATISMARSPEGVGVDPSTHAVYLSDAVSNVSVIDGPGPTSVTAAAGNTAAAVSWKAPVFLFGGAVTGYTAAASPGGETCSTTGATSCTITGLTNDTTYSVTVVAHTTTGDPAAAPAATVVPWGPTCPCTLWPSTMQPAVASSGDTNAVNLGVQFTPAVDGQVTGIRFYKGPGNTGTHTGELWTASGTLLGKATFTGESASGWQEADFSSPIAVTAGATYVASYFAPNGGYSYTASGFASAGVTNGPLTAPASSAVSGGNGVYAYASSPAFPDATYKAANYWADVVFTTPPGGRGPTVTASTPDSGSPGNPVTVAPTATFSQAVVPDSASFTLTDPSGNTAAGSVSFNSADTTATFTPSSALAPDTAYTAAVSAQTVSDAAMASPYSWTFTTAGSQCPCSLWPPTAQPAVASANDPSAVNLGVQFTPSANGWIAGIRFYKGAGNTGTHTGELWTASGTLLGKVTFTGQSASGWQEADFSSPIAVTADTAYVASYFAPNGGYAYDGGYFASTSVTNGPLTAPQSSAVSGGNGVYAYGSSPSFPDANYNATNYWIDVVFTHP